MNNHRKGNFLAYEPITAFGNGETFIQIKFMQRKTNGKKQSWRTIQTGLLPKNGKRTSALLMAWPLKSVIDNNIPE